MSESDAACPLTLRPQPAVVTEQARGTTFRRARPMTGKAVANGRSPLAVFLMSAAMLAIGADAPQSAIEAAASHTRIVVIQPGKNGDGRPIVALANPVCTKDAGKLEDTYQGILNRELTRQALLIAARDELGLATRDEVLGDLISADALNKTASTVELVTVLHTVEGKLSPALVRRGEAASSQPLFQRDLADGNVPARERRSPVEIAENWSRTEFPNVLKQLGLDGKPNALQPDAPLPAGVDDRLSQLGYIGVFAAIRDLHDAMRTSGESPRRIAALVRAYALMGLLTEHHWHPAHKVFKARALLYAQRLVTRVPNDSNGLWHRAFALATIGLHKRAQEDIALARARATAENKPNPAWADLIEAYAHYDITRMNVSPGPLAPLAALLRLMAVEYPVMTDLTLLAAKDVLTLAPDCYRAHESMCRVGGVSNLHEATTAGPLVFAGTLKQKLLALEPLPNSIKTHLENPEGDETTIWKLLSQSGDPGADTGEPSWAVLGRLFRETRFVQVFRRLNFMRYGWGVPVRDYWLQAVSVVADHPYRQYLETMVWPPEKASQSLTNLIEQLDVANLELSSYPMLKVIFQSRHAQKLVAWDFAVRHLDFNAHDLSAVVEYSDGIARCAHAQRLLEFSPDCPYAKATLIERDWEVAKPHIVEWERDANKAPAILAALARRYSEIGKYDEAQRALVRYIRFSPDYWAYEQIAKNFKGRGDLEHWQSTLEDFLAKSPDHGLTHAQVNVQLANHFMERKQWDMATHFAEAAAETGAQWAMVCAERCAEGRTDWVRAEGYARQISQRYPKGWARWFLFCKRTGQGDLQSAQSFAEKHVLPDDDRPELPGPTAVGYFYWLTGDTKRAMTWFKKADQAKPTAQTCFNLILLGDEVGDTDTRDEAIRVFLNRFRRPYPRVCQIYEILRRSFKDPARPASIDLKAIDKIMQPMVPSARGLNTWLVGLYVKNHGKPEDARRYMKEAVELRAVHEWGQLVAADALRKLGDDNKANKAADAAAK